MKTFRRMICLGILLFSLISGAALNAQQYEVKVQLGAWVCGDNTYQLPVSGSISIGPSGGASGSALSQSFSETAGSNSEVFVGVFDYMPTRLTFNANEFFAPYDPLDPEGTSCSEDIFSVTQSLIGQGTYQEYILQSQGGQQTITMGVTITSMGLSPGTIGSNQTICELQIPDIITGTDAIGGANISYRWEYANSNPGTWLPVLTDPADPASIVTTESYQPPRPIADIWYRRVAIDALGGIEEPSNAVIIALASAGEERHILKITMEEYKCDDAPFTPFMEMVANIDGTSFEGQGTPANGALVLPVILHEFTARPQQMSLDVSQVFGGDESISCFGVINGTIDLSLQTTDQEYYTLTSNGQELRILVEIASTGESLIHGGVIGNNQLYCETVADAEDLMEISAPIGATGEERYAWEFSTNAGIDWMRVEATAGEPANTANLMLGAINTDTWYRRLVVRDCSRGYSNVVSVRFDSPETVSIGGVEGPYEIGDAPVEIFGYPGGGTFSVNGAALNADANQRYFFTPSAAGPGNHTIQYSYTSAAGCVSTAILVVRVKAEALCSSIVPLSGNGEFKMDHFSGKIIYRKTTDDCEVDIPVSCIAAEPDAPVIPQVIQASAVSLSDEWDYTGYHLSRYEAALSEANDFETGVLGRWRGKDSYVYNTSELARDKNYNTGTFNMSLFNWQYDDVNQRDRWIQASSVTKYSPNGEALEEVNAIGIASAVKMGYYDNVPYLTVQNATYESVFFESFEVDYSGKFESGARTSSGGTQDKSTAHAGYQSLLLPSGDGVITPVMNVSNHATTTMVQVWVKGGTDEQLRARLINDANGQDILTSEMTHIARSGDWGLYQTLLNPDEHISFQVGIMNEGGESIILDDMRIQPIDAEMTCYVYDPATLRLLTIFDSQHFGLYYQYDGEGKLVRKTIETERGTRTLQETFYNVPKVDRND